MTDDLISFFGLTGDPFERLRDATDLFEAPSQSQMVSQVLTDVASEPGVVTLRGQAGVGKSSICQLIALALRLHGVLAVEIAGGRQNPMQMQTQIGHTAGIAAPDQLTPDQLARELPGRLGRNGLVLVIDDAQQLSEVDYRYVLLLRAALGFTNVGFGLILVGSAGRWPAMEAVDAPGLRPETMARQVIFAWREDELAELLRHRFRLAGGSVTQVLSPAALQGLVREADGMPGELAALTASAMAAAYASRRRRVTLRMVWPVLSAESGRGELIWRSLRGPAIAAACLLLLGAGAAGYVWRDDWQPVRVRLAAGLDTVAIVAGLKQPGSPPAVEAELTPPPTMTQTDPSPPMAPPAVEPSPAPPEQVASAPASPVPTAPAPASTAPVPAAPAPVEPAPVEPAPVEPAPVESAPVEPGPVPPAPPGPAAGPSSTPVTAEPLDQPPVSAAPPPAEAAPPPTSVSIVAPAEPSGGPSEFQPIEAVPLPPPAPAEMPPAIEASQPPATPPPSPPPPSPELAASTQDAVPPPAPPAPAGITPPSPAPASAPAPAAPPPAVPRPAPAAEAAIAPAKPTGPAHDTAHPSKEPPPHQSPRGSPGLILVAGADDTLPALYARVYRGVTPPPYAEVLAANHSPVRPGDLLIFPEPPNGWSKREPR